MVKAYELTAHMIMASNHRQVQRPILLWPCIAMVLYSCSLDCYGPVWPWPHIGTAYLGVVYLVVALYSYTLQNYGECSYGLYSYGLYS